MTINHFYVVSIVIAMYRFGKFYASELRLSESANELTNLGVLILTFLFVGFISIICLLATGAFFLMYFLIHTLIP
jgi:hypothetical protein